MIKLYFFIYLVVSALVDSEVKLRNVDRVAEPEAGLEVRNWRKVCADLRLAAKLPVATQKLAGRVARKFEFDAVIRHLSNKKVEKG